MADHKILVELKEAATIKKAAKEDEETFVVRLVKDVAKLGDDDWDQLSDVTQEWVNAAIGAVNEKGNLPPFPDGGEKKASKPKEEKKAAETKGAAETKEAGETAAKEEKSKPKVAPTKKAAKPVEKEKKVKKPAATPRILELVCKDHKTTVEKIHKQLEKEGFTVKEVTVQLHYDWTQAVIKKLREAGKLKD